MGEELEFFTNVNQLESVNKLI